MAKIGRKNLRKRRKRRNLIKVLIRLRRGLRNWRETYRIELENIRERR